MNRPIQKPMRSYHPKTTIHHLLETMTKPITIQEILEILGRTTMTTKEDNLHKDLLKPNKQ